MIIFQAPTTQQRIDESNECLLFPSPQVGLTLLPM
jgi:hypothetical protein